ncbi:alpha/beta fold hydrolase [Fodinicola feengrottensis]|uniref:hypothetical protein n=1 Tax=Fodinicola feengrottensis TaxID=435914 RepID=UPI0013D7ECEF|nr:hypothetical protein [Fodinicola feengrottensis]
MTTVPAVPRADGVRASVPATAVVDGAQVRYWTYYPTPRLDGHSPVIVMVHGFRGTHQGLELIAGNLSEFQVVSPDLPVFLVPRRRCRAASTMSPAMRRSSRA